MRDLQREERSTYYYHLIPRSMHAKVLKNDQLRRMTMQTCALNTYHVRTVWFHLWLLCTPCHSAVHHIASDDKVTVASTQLTSS
ncbi:hypothetical protein CY34DRAFT_536704 [Suillus luteus UH-Slu-Lm8-n1]|uniref:Uncharacterized protein n=1 Tax=Suillus luteus UH-Slu-Lm8-n1 TaxID=930992 RepID=A0A0C9ZFF3_9AGAM|nr:hypothetical protein CY34DRAFT_536704 [Suillus luteus UH-Slu-Lm8-n1]